MVTFWVCFGGVPGSQGCVLVAVARPWFCVWFSGVRFGCEGGAKACVRQLEARPTFKYFQRRTSYRNQNAPLRTGNTTKTHPKRNQTTPPGHQENYQSTGIRSTNGSVGMSVTTRGANVRLGLVGRNTPNTKVPELDWDAQETLGASDPPHQCIPHHHSIALAQVRLPASPRDS